MKKVICEGNECGYTYFSYNGCAHFYMKFTDIGDDDFRLIYEDGLYKLFKNGELVMAATSALIEYKDTTTH